MKNYEKSFKTLLSEALNLNSKDQLLIIYDDFFLPFLDSLINVINKKRALAIYSFLPYSYQQVLIKQHDILSKKQKNQILPKALKGAIGESTIILNFLSDNSSTTKIRRAIVQEKKLSNCRLAHLPGINEFVLKGIARSPFNTIKQSSELLAWALGEADHAEILTYDSEGKTYTLNLKLGGWEDEPIMSPGVLFPGTWGNTLPGETFCCPKYTDVNGQICIDGSIPKIIIKPKEEAILDFKKGKMVKWSSSNKKILEFFDQKEKNAKKNGDTNWNIFAELGFGLNPWIKRLTGNSLFDEKMANTIHIAIGDNSGFGFNIKSDIHVDMITKKPTVKLEGKEIINRGIYNEELLRNWRKEAVIDSLNLSNKTFYFNDARVFISEDNKILRKCTKPGRICHIDIIGEDENLQILIKKIIEYFNKKKGMTQYEKLLKNFDGEKNELRKALNILIHYKIIEYN